MTVTTTVSRNVKQGNGSTKKFSISFEFFDATDLLVRKIGTDNSVTTWTLNNQYTISGGGGSTGELQTTQGNTLQSGEQLVIERQTEQTQALDLVANDILPAESIEKGLDILTMIAQEANQGKFRALRIPPEDAMTIAEIPNRTERADKVLAFDSNGSPIVLIPENVISDTDDVPEGSSNLYFTDERAQDAVASAATADAGIQINYDDQNNSLIVGADVVSVFGRTGQVQAQAGDYDTDQVTEASNLYFTDERAQDAAANMLTGGSGITTNYDDGANTFTISVNAGGGLQFNAGALAVDPGNGLELSSGQIQANLGNGLTFNAGTIATQLGDGLDFSGNNIQADLGDGLEFSSGQIQAKLGGGLAFFSGNIGVDSTVARKTVNNVFESGVEGGQQTIKGGFPNIFLFEDDNPNDNARLEVRNNGDYTLRSVDDDGSSNVTTRWTTNLPTGVHDAQNGRIENVPDPTNNQDAANKQFIEDWSKPDLSDKTFVEARLGTNQSISVSTFVKVDWDQEDNDRNGDFDPNNGEFTAPVSGIYMIAPYVHFATDDSSSGSGTFPVAVAINVNGTRVKRVAEQVVPGGGTPGLQVGSGVPVKLNANDTVTIEVFVGASDSATINSNDNLTHLTIARMFL